MSGSPTTAGGQAAPPPTRRAAREGRRRGGRPSLPRPSLPRPSREGLRTAVGRRLTRLVPLREATRVVWEPVLGVLRWVSPVGWTVLALGLVAWWIGARFEWPELLMVAMTALLLLALCVLLALGAVRLEIDVHLAQRRVTVGDSASGSLRVRNASRASVLPVPLTVEVPIGAALWQMRLGRVARGQVVEDSFEANTTRRGVVRVGPATSVQGDPLGLVRRTVHWNDSQELFVHPRTVPLAHMGAGLLRDLEGSVTQDQSRSDMEFHTLREFTPGDDRRHIAWRATARTGYLGNPRMGSLLVRQFLDTRRSHVTVVVDSDLGAYDEARPMMRPVAASSDPDRTSGALAATSPLDLVEDFETAVSAGASIVVRALLDEMDATLVVGDRRVTKAAAPRYLDELSRAEPSPVSLLRAATSAVELAPDTSTVFLVTGPHRPFLEVRRALGQFPPEVRAIAVVVDPRGAGGLQRGDGLAFLSLRTLSDLRPLVQAGLHG